MISDAGLAELEREGGFLLAAAEHLRQLSDELEADASWAKLQGVSAALLAPKAHDLAEMLLRGEQEVGK